MIQQQQKGMRDLLEMMRDLLEMMRHQHPALTAAAGTTQHQKEWEGMRRKMFGDRSSQSFGRKMNEERESSGGRNHHRHHPVLSAAEWCWWWQEEKQKKSRHQAQPNNHYWLQSSQWGEEMKWSSSSSGVRTLSSCMSCMMPQFMSSWYSGTTPHLVSLMLIPILSDQYFLSPSDCIMSGHHFLPSSTFALWCASTFTKDLFGEWTHSSSPPSLIIIMQNEPMRLYYHHEYWDDDEMSESCGVLCKTNISSISNSYLTRFSSSVTTHYYFDNRSLSRSVGVMMRVALIHYEMIFHITSTTGVG